MNTWHQRLTAAREALGITKAELARRVKVSAPTVTDWESGKIKTPDAPHLLRLCQVLGRSTYWLMDGRSDPSLPPTPLEPSARHQALLGYFDALTAAQQDEVLRDLSAKKSLNDELLAQLLARKCGTR